MELAHAIMEEGKSQDGQGESASWKPKRSMGSSHPKVSRLKHQQGFFCLGNGQPFVLFRLSTD